MANCSATFTESFCIFDAILTFALARLHVEGDVLLHIDTEEIYLLFVDSLWQDESYQTVRNTPI